MLNVDFECKTCMFFKSTAIKPGTLFVGTTISLSILFEPEVFPPPIDDKRAPSTPNPLKPLDPESVGAAPYHL